MTETEMTEDEFFELEKRLTKIVRENSPLFRKLQNELQRATEETAYWQHRQERLDYLVGRIFWRYIKQHKVT